MKCFRMIDAVVIVVMAAWLVSGCAFHLHWAEKHFHGENNAGQTVDPADEHDSRRIQNSDRTIGDAGNPAPAGTGKN